MTTADATPKATEATTAHPLSSLVSTAKVDGLFRHSLSTGTLFYERTNGRATWAEFYPLSSFGKCFEISLGESGEVVRITLVTRTTLPVSGADSRSRGRQQLFSCPIERGSGTWRHVTDLIRTGLS
jgi:hypothetical protein